MEFIYLISGLVVGAVLLHFISSSRFMKKQATLESENKMLHANGTFVKEKNTELISQLELKEKQLLDLTSKLSGKSSDLSHLTDYM